MSGHWEFLPASTPVWASISKWPTTWACRPSSFTPPTPRVARPSGPRVRRARDELDMKFTVVFGGFEGESYADIPTVKRTVGLVPPETRAARLAEMKEIADFARLLGVDAVGLHLGFVPHEAADPVYGQAVAVVSDLCSHCNGLGQRVHLETGQESADTLLRFLSDTGCGNLFVNFDPANMILYGSGDPIEAFRKSAATCGASTARTPAGPPGQARSGAPRRPWARATWAWSGFSARSRKSVMTAP